MKLKILQGKHFQKGRLIQTGEEFECETPDATLRANPGRFAIVDGGASEQSGTIPKAPFSTGMRAEEAIALIAEAGDLESIGAFIQGEERKKVLFAAVKRREEIEEELTRPDGPK